MSGRKQSEVVNLLSSGNKIREQVLKNNFLNIEKYIVDQNEIEKKFVEEMEKLNFNFFNSSQELKGKYENEIKNIEEEVDEIKSWKNSLKLNNLEGLKKELITKRKELNDCDIEGENLRKRIIGKSHYCDAEYNQAKILVETYKSKSNRISQIEKECLVNLLDNKEKINKLRENNKKNDLIKDKLNSLKTRALAENHRQEIENEMSKLNKEDSEKFLKKDYDELIKEVGLLLKSNDLEINKGAQKMYIKIADVSTQVLSKKCEFDFKKTRTEENLSSLLDLVTSFEVDDVKALLDGNNIGIGLFEFQKSYGLDSYEAEYLKSTKEIASLIKNEQFDEAYHLVDYLKENLYIQINKANKQYERLLKEQDLVIRMYNVMNKLGYDEVDIDYLDEDILKGYKLSAKVGDEILDFDRIAIGDDGKQILDINHKESVSGQCGASMKVVMGAMQEEGIFITDITKNGSSIIYKDKATIIANRKENERKVDGKK